MKRKTIVYQPPKSDFVSIDTEDNKVPRSWDSIDFDEIPAERIFKKFDGYYQQHVDTILNLVASRLAFGTAITNVNNSVNDATSESIELDDKGELTTTLDELYERAMLLYATEHSLKLTLSAEFRADVIKTMEPRIRTLIKRAADAENNTGIAAVATHGKDNHERNISRLSKKFGVDSESPPSPYGEIDEQDKSPKSSKSTKPDKAPLPKSKSGTLVKKRRR